MARSKSVPHAEETAGAPALNEVRLIGRLSGDPTTRLLPSGDELTTWRIVVDRPEPRGPSNGRRSPTVDTIDCVAHKPAIRRLASRWPPGAVLEISGALRRRFWRGAAGPASRCEVEVVAAKKL
ncbi:MAG: single-stranded DNA-binding protein [Acidothermaceae bacterium]